MNIIGIDPGKDGAIAVLWAGGGIDASVTPTLKIGKGKSNKRDYDLVAMRDLLDAVRYAGDCHVFLERAQAMRRPGKVKQGTASSFATGRGFGIWEGLVAGLQMPVTIVAPRTWQAIILRDIPGENPKGRALVAARRLFPKTTFLKTSQCKKPHDGLVDAALIARFGKMRFSQSPQAIGQTSQSTAAPPPHSPPACTPLSPCPQNGPPSHQRPSWAPPASPRR